MTASDFLSDMQVRGVRVRRDGADVEVTDPLGALTDDHRAYFREHKAEILEELSVRDQMISGARVRGVTPAVRPVRRVKAQDQSDRPKPKKVIRVSSASPSAPAGAEERRTRDMTTGRFIRSSTHPDAAPAAVENRRERGPGQRVDWWDRWVLGATETEPVTETNVDHEPEQPGALPQPATG